MGNFRIDKTCNKAYLGLREISLDTKEFEVLWLLASQPSKTFSSEDIINVIMESGIMLHEKQFIELMTKSICKKAGVSFIQKTIDNKFRFNGNSKS